MTKDEILQEVFTAPFNTQPSALGYRIVQTEDWYQVFNKNVPTPAMNEVIHSAIPSEQVNETIERTIAEYNAIGAPFKWSVTQWSKPATLADALIAHVFASWTTRGMFIDLNTFNEEIPPHAKLERVTRETIDEYVETSLIGWNRQTPSESQRKAMRTVTEHNVTQRPNEIQSFILKVGGVAAGTCGFIIKERSVFLIAANVLSDFRGQGLYRAMLAGRAQEARALGLSLATTHAREATSAPILEKLGFQTAYKYRVFQYGGILPE